MKFPISKLLLALSLVVNSVAVLATNLHLDPAGNDMNVVECHDADQQSNPAPSLQHDETDCEKSCCKEANCLEQGTCVLHNCSALVATQPFKLYLAAGHGDWDALVANVPDCELPPDNPPPIHV